MVRPWKCIKGQKFGLSIALHPVAGQEGVYPSWQKWVCLCECGKKYVTTADRLKRKDKPRSCGCYRKDRFKEEMSQSLLKELVHYDPETGLFTVKKKRYKQQIGDNLGHKKKDNGYLTTSIFKKSYYLHRLAWLYMTGEWPSEDIDHINMVRDDNRWANLRSATRPQNEANKKSRSRTGFRGVGKHREGPNWFASFCGKGLGTFGDPVLAALAYDQAIYNAHGGRARTNFDLVRCL